MPAGRCTAWRNALVVVLIALATAALDGCGGGDANTLGAHSDIAAIGSRPGGTPFIAFAELSGASLAQVTSVGYAIQRKPYTVSRLLRVGYTIAALARRGYAESGATTLTLPIFGLYAGYANTVQVALHFTDGSTQVLPLTITTDAYVDPNGLYDHGKINISRVAGSHLGFDFFAMKTGDSTPVVVDTDGNVRWVGTGLASSQSSIYLDNGFYVGSPTSTGFTRLELDGTSTAGTLNSSTALAFHHNIDHGATSMLVELNTASAGIDNLESTIAEMTPTGAVTSQWDLAALISAYMASQGDDPTQFVRYGIDWFHSNSATYDPSDNSLIVSSRENFVIKIDYLTGAIKWILGDPTKYWYTFPSLRAKALTLTAGGLYPIGQHATSLTTGGLLLLFDDGQGSFNQPAGAPAGETRTYSVVSAYSIDPGTMTAQEAWRYDAGQAIFNQFCGSAYEAEGGSLLINYAMDNGPQDTRLIGLDSNHEVVFDFQFPSPSICTASWNAVPVPFEALQFD